MTRTSRRAASLAAALAALTVSSASGLAASLEDAKVEAAVPFNEFSGSSSRKSAAIRTSAATNAAIASVVTQMIIRHSQAHGGSGAPPPPSPSHPHGSFKRRLFHLGAEARDLVAKTHHHAPLAALSAGVLMLFASPVLGAPGMIVGLAGVATMLASAFWARRRYR